MKTILVICSLTVLSHCVLSQEGRNFTVHGDKYVDVGIQLSGRTWVTFQVQTSKDATVGLFPYFGWMNLSYEFVIGAGNNTYATIREKHLGPNLMLTYINGLVSAVELRWFWISWRKNHISYGRGNQHGQNVIGWYEDLSPKSIEIMKISSFGNISGLWIIPAVYYISDYRLVNNSLITEGQLENQYGVPFSIESFDDHEAGVACLTLGFRRSGRVVNHRYTLQRLKIFVYCKGYESALRECTQRFDTNTTRIVFISCDITDRILYPDRTQENNIIPLGNTSADVGVLAFTLWINKIPALRAGILKNVYALIGRQSTDPSLKRLQIWRPVSESDYVLIWERIANFTAAHTRSLYRFDVSADNVEVSDGDWIGWVNEDNNTWIVADHCLAVDPCQCSALYDFATTYDWPIVNKTSTNFTCQPYNFSVSVAVEMQPSTTLSNFTAEVTLSAASSAQTTMTADGVDATVTSTDTGMIVGIVVGAFAVICLAEAVVIAVVICVRRGKKAASRTAAVQHNTGNSYNNSTEVDSAGYASVGAVDQSGRTPAYEILSSAQTPSPLPSDHPPSESVYDDIGNDDYLELVDYVEPSKPTKDTNV